MAGRSGVGAMPLSSSLSPVRLHRLKMLGLRTRPEKDTRALGRRVRWESSGCACIESESTSSAESPGPKTRLGGILGLVEPTPITTRRDECWDRSTAASKQGNSGCCQRPKSRYRRRVRKRWLYRTNCTRITVERCSATDADAPKSLLARDPFIGPRCRTIAYRRLHTSGLEVPATFKFIRYGRLTVSQYHVLDYRAERLC